MSQLMRCIKDPLVAETFWERLSCRGLLALLVAATLGGPPATHGQEVRWGQPVTPSAGLVQQAGSTPTSQETYIQQLMRKYHISHAAAVERFQDERRSLVAPSPELVQQGGNTLSIQEANIQQLMKRYNISRAAATERSQNEQRQREAQEEEQAARPAPLDTLIATYGADAVENLIRWMIQKKEKTRDEATQDFIADPEGWRRQKDIFEQDILYADGNQAVLSWMHNEMKLSDPEQSLIDDPEGWKQRYQQHLQQVDTEQEQGRKQSAQALNQQKAQRAALAQATNTATDQGKYPPYNKQVN
jgi:hypothetical protein